MAASTPAPAPPSRPWPDLFPDLLLQVSARIHDAADFVRFHAVCKPWRNSTPLPLSPATATARPAFLPWLLASCDGRILRSRVNYSRRPSSAADHRSCAPLGDDEGGRNWVARADGTAAWLFFPADADKPHPSPRLLDLLTGAVTPLPQFRDDDVRSRIRQAMANPRSIVYGDGTVFLYSFTPADVPWQHDFTAAVLRPGGNATWAVARTRFMNVEETRHSSAAYHDGKILVCAQPGKLVGGGSNSFTAGDDHSPALSVNVHALKVQGGGAKARWVERDGRSLRDRVLFLGLGVSGGSVYFFFRSRVLTYNLVKRKGELVERLPPGWGADGACVWLSPQPTICSI
ncbi:hypothetical protein BRADI_4g38222v3 [Brachypodium distachyon]|uniref:DUF295 domain-containing protein n=1 Tax=Brachypodium distachyon TaxID=15368 RepID=A0A2K2CT25_BRADI|nr:hypothetical protein BRADI_4g38222v3 [Brachypodium distachyon]